MHDSGLFELDWTTVFLIVLSVAVLFLQIWLCRKGKKLLVKLIPLGILILSTVVFHTLSVWAAGWDALGYLFFALLSAWLVVVCGIGWGIWALRKGGVS